jgi:general secretion pathway protein L
MQRQTPFRAEQVYFNYRVVARRAETQQLTVQFSVVPRTVVDKILNPIAGWDLAPEQGEGKSEQDQRVFAFVPAGAGLRVTSGFYRLLLVANLALLVAVVGVPMLQQQRYLEQLRARLTEIRAAATTASNLQQRIDQHLARSRYLFAQKVRQPASVELLEELSARLPDDTWLFRVEIRDGKVHLQGTSTRASALIAELEDSRFLENVRFASPVTQDGASGRQRFHLSASVVPPPRPTLAGSSEGRDS